VKLAVIGTGYVGLVTGAGFSDFGHDVTCVDIDAGRVAALTRGVIPIFEPGLPELVQRNAKLGRLHFTTSIEAAMAGAQLALIAVGTPSRPDGSADLSFVLEAAQQIGAALTGFTVVATKSTVPVGTADRVREAVATRAKHPFAVASNPEFLKEGDAVNDFLRPARVVIGADDPRALAVLRDAYAGVMRTGDRLQVMDIRSAELTKYAANAMLATRVSFMNELARLAETVGADIESIRKGIGADPRIGSKFLFAGAGFGGSCLLGGETVLLRENGEVRCSTLGSLVTERDTALPACVQPERLEALAWTADGPTFLPVAAITRRGYEGEICDVRTKMGRRIACTPDHPFVVMDEHGSTPRIVLAEQLAVNDWVPVATGPAANATESRASFDVLSRLLADGMPHQQIIVRAGERVREPNATETLRSVVRDKNRLADIRRSGTLRLDEATAAQLALDGSTIGTSRSGTYVPITLPNDPDFWRVIGLYCAEGWITTDLGRDGARRMRISWAFHPRDEEHLVAEICAFWSKLGVKTSVYTRPTTRTVTVSSRLLATWMMRVLGVGSDCYTQRVPDALWSAPASHKRAFVSGAWHGDGSWSHASGRRGAVLEYGTASREMADGLLRLLGELDVVASWKIGRPPGSTIDTHFIRISGADQVEQLLDLVQPGERVLAARAIASQTKRIAATGYRSDPHRVRITQVTRRRFRGYVYSMEVPGAETVVTTGGLVVHNCFPKDLRALLHTARERDVELGVVDAVERANERQKRVLGERVIAHFGGRLEGKTVAVWGLAFKPETDDIRESPALVLVEQLRAAGARVVGYDPAAAANVRDALGNSIDLADEAYAAANGADALVLVTEWHELRHPDLSRLRQTMRTPVLFDGRNVWSPDDARSAGFTYYGIGRR
jgi:UDPglucose 6-dehydrogenase